MEERGADRHTEQGKGTAAAPVSYGECVYRQGCTGEDPAQSTKVRERGRRHLHISRKV